MLTGFVDVGVIDLLEEVDEVSVEVVLVTDDVFVPDTVTGVVLMGVLVGGLTFIFARC